ncbi:ATP-dependent RNA helicase DDX24-like [Littorina saxatilis]|uniref:ATP-dependent RNA helicase n=1 Tax=Littorina saxatilis TaxID=31220 RepID=A0AAN9B8T2_9CAEN
MASMCKRFHVKAKSAWKKVEIPLTDGFDDLIELQELSDYELSGDNDDRQPGLQVQLPEQKVKKKKKKKKKVQKAEETATYVNDAVQEEESTDQEEAGDGPQTQTKSLKNKKTGDESQRQKKSPKSKKHLNGDKLSSQEIQLDTMQSWKGLGVSPVLLQALEEEGFNDPTPVQALALPDAIFHKMDIIAAAETGSGKTLGFGLPVLENILSCGVDAERLREEGPCALILEPTRELAMQVHKHLKAAARHTNIQVVTVVGGMAAQKQHRLLKRCPHIIVATPGRLWELIQEGDGHLNKLHNINQLVVDEADRMIEKGHFEELSKVFSMLSEKSAGLGKRQHFIFSATLTMDHAAPQRPMKKKRKKNAKDAKQKMDALVSQLDIQDKPKIIDLTRKEVMVDTLTETRIDCQRTEKDLYLYYVLRKYGGRTLVFCNSKDCIRRLVSVFSLLGCSPLPLHSDMHQRQRLKNLDKFAEKSTSLLLASDVAARGLDIKGIDHVVHYQVPFTVENYVHRSGRTARASREGLSVILVCPDEIKMYRNILKLKQGQDFAPFPVDPEVLKVVKGHVDMATSIDLLQHRLKKTEVHKNWMQKAAEEMDIELDEDLLGLEEDNGEQSQLHQDKVRLKQDKQQLTALLKQPLLPSTFSGRYPTQTGQLVMPKKFIQGSAVRDCLKRKRPGK